MTKQWFNIEIGPKKCSKWLNKSEADRWNEKAGDLENP
jgi:hypothetical protein